MLKYDYYTYNIRQTIDKEVENSYREYLFKWKYVYLIHNYLDFEVIRY